MSTDQVIPSESIVENTTQKLDGPLNYRAATLDDCESLRLLVESCFRGESSCQGWTSEHHLLGGQRIDTEMLTNLLNDNQSTTLLFFNPKNNNLVGCVHLQNYPGTEMATLGLLSISPTLQNQGYGKYILAVAENYVANNWNAEYIEITVIDVRTELLDFYTRRGFTDTGRRKPFPFDDPKYGCAKRRDFEFVVMRKSVKSN